MMTYFVIQLSFLRSCSLSCPCLFFSPVFPDDKISVQWSRDTLMCISRNYRWHALYSKSVVHLFSNWHIPCNHSEEWHTIEPRVIRVAQLRHFTIQDPSLKCSYYLILLNLVLLFKFLVWRLYAITTLKLPSFRSQSVFKVFV